MSESTISQRWDQEYAAGRYMAEPPIKFIDRIKDMLYKDNGFSMQKDMGLYVGCGNGRNYIPLVDSGLNIFGIDISQTAIDILSKRAPYMADRLQCVNFLDFDPKKQFDYIISIQIFQHGNEANVRRYFNHASKLLKRGRMLFLRVNYRTTQVCFKHKIIENNHHKGFTVHYEEGPKKGLDIHFFHIQNYTI